MTSTHFDAPLQERMNGMHCNIAGKGRGGRAREGERAGDSTNVLFDNIVQCCTM